MGDYTARTIFSASHQSRMNNDPVGQFSSQTSEVAVESTRFNLGQVSNTFIHKVMNSVFSGQEMGSTVYGSTSPGNHLSPGCIVE